MEDHHQMYCTCTSGKLFLPRHFFHACPLLLRHVTWMMGNCLMIVCYQEHCCITMYSVNGDSTQLHLVKFHHLCYNTCGTLYIHVYTCIPNFTPMCGVFIMYSMSSGVSCAYMYMYMCVRCMLTVAVNSAFRKWLCTAPQFFVVVDVVFNHGLLPWRWHTHFAKQVWWSALRRHGEVLCNGNDCCYPFHPWTRLCTSVSLCLHQSICMHTCATGRASPWE